MTYLFCPKCQLLVAEETVSEVCEDCGGWLVPADTGTPKRKPRRLRLEPVPETLGTGERSELVESLLGALAGAFN